MSNMNPNVMTEETAMPSPETKNANGKGKIVVFHLLQLILTICYTALIAFSLKDSLSVLQGGISMGLTTIFMLALAAWLLFNTAFVIVRLAWSEKPILDVIRCILAVLAAAVATYVAFSKAESWIFALAAVAIAGLQLVLAFTLYKKARSVETEETEQVVLSEAQVADGFYTETYAEAYPYEGGPVNGVVMAEEATPSFLAKGPHVNTAGYDFYNCKSFDPFIASLDNDERNEFTDLFIMRFKGDMPEIPSYEVGGNNAEFFHLIFIYLGKYRDRISSKLLNKIYQFANKLS